MPISLKVLSLFKFILFSWITNDKRKKYKWGIYYQEGSMPGKFWLRPRIGDVLLLYHM